MTIPEMVSSHTAAVQDCQLSREEDQPSRSCAGASSGNQGWNIPTQCIKARDRR